MKNISWEEPAAFKRAFNRKHYGKPKSWLPPLLLFGFAGVLILFAWLHNNLVANSWSISVLVAFAIGAVPSYFLPFVSSHSPRIIIFSEKGINRNGWEGGAMRLEYWSWDKIARVSLGNLTLEDKTYPVVTAHFHNNSAMPFALSRKVSVHDLEQLILFNQKQLVRL